MPDFQRAINSKSTIREDVDARTVCDIAVTIRNALIARLVHSAVRSTIETRRRKDLLAAVLLRWGKLIVNRLGG
jgi:hypothetical protein